MTSSLTPEALREALDSDDPLAVLDIRDPLDYVEGHLPACTHVPRRDLEHRLPTLVPNRATPVVLCDRDGDRAARDARWLTELGYESVSFLDGGVDAWAEAGFELVEAVDQVNATALNYTSKRFGEEVDVERELPKVGPSELHDMLEREDPLVVDVRNPEEYHRWGTIPGAINVEGVDLALYADELRDPERPVVVHCAGRTRSIIGTATLEALGVENVYELENGTMGWQLAGYDLVEGSGRPEGVTPDPTRVERLRESVESLLDDAGVSRLDPDGRGPPRGAERRDRPRVRDTRQGGHHGVLALGDGVRAGVGSRRGRDRVDRGRSIRRDRGRAPRPRELGRRP
jgi:rhodanese-related sulfurtransferase